jgi:hypothetical protein
MPSCSQTGLAIPECSCARCLTEQLRRFQPALLRGGRDDRSRRAGDRGEPRGDGRIAA